MFAKHQITQPWDQTHHPPRDRCELKPTTTIITQPLSTYTVISFKENSTLKEYITRKTRISKHFWTIGETLAAIMKVIAMEGLFDKGNPKMVLCSPELEVILGRKALLSSQLTDSIMNQVAFPLNYAMRPVNVGCSHLEFPQENSLSRRTSSIATQDKTLFELKPKFLEVIKNVSRKSRKHFTITEVTRLLKKYIYHRHDKIIDLRNPTVALVSEDPLGEAFELQAFHLSQLRSLILMHISSVTTRCNPQRQSRRKMLYK